MSETGAQIVPVAISILIILLIAILRSYSNTVAAITATMPLTVPLALWIVYAAEGGDQLATTRFIESMLIGVLATLVSVLAMWWVARAGWGLVPIIVATYSAWGVFIGVFFIVRQMLRN